MAATDSVLKVCVVGAGLGGLAAALRLQGAGHEVVVLEQCATPGGRAARIRDGGFTWDTGPSLLTMPWVLEDLFAADGRDVRSELALHRLDPLYRIRWAGFDEHLDFCSDVGRLREQIAKLSPRDAGALDGYLAAVEPIYREAILDAGRRAFGLGDLVRFLPTMVRTGAARSLWHLTARHFTDERVREAFSFHSLFIGGDPFRVPAVYAALVHLQIADGGWYCEGGVYALVEALARGLDVRCGGRVERIEHRGGRVRGVVLDDGTTVGADVVVYNGDVLRLHELTGMERSRRRLRPTMSCLLLYLGSQRRWSEQLLHHTLLVGPGYRDFIADVTRRGRTPRSFSTYVHAPSRTEAAMAPAGGDSLSVLLPMPNLRSGVRADSVRDALLADMESSFGLEGLRDSIVAEHRMTPEDFRDRLGAVDGNAFSLEPTLVQSAAFRPANRDRRLAGLYLVGGGTHPGAGIPGVLLGAEITAGLVRDDNPVPMRRRNLAAAAA